VHHTVDEVYAQPAELLLDEGAVSCEALEGGAQMVLD
jgi:hypothetical protein